MKVVFQIDPIERLKPKTDSTLLIMKGALKRGMDVWFYYPSDLLYKENKLYAKGFKFFGEQKERDSTLLDLEEFNFLFLRQDPPFNMNYLTTTYLLENLKKCKVLNNPVSVRSAPEKLFVLQFSDFTPSTIISSNEKEIRDFWKDHKEIVLKPLYSHGGEGVFYVPGDDKNLFNLCRILKENYKGLPIIAQKYLPDVKNGDKRILFINGELAGAFNRIQAHDFAISNTAAGSRHEKTELSFEENKICEILKPIFKKMELFLVGIDVIGNMITEINVTCPTGFVLINEVHNIQVEEKILDAMLNL